MTHTETKQAARRRWVLPLILLAITAGSIALFLWQNDLSTMGGAFGGADPLLAVAAIGLFILHHLARAERFGVLVAHLHDGGRWLPLRALTIGVAANNVLPTKAGLVARAHVISSETPMTKGAASGRFIVEALFDGLFVLTLMLVALALVPLGVEVRLSVLAFTGFVGFGALLAVLAVTGRLSGTPVRMALRHCPLRLSKPLTELARQAGEGIVSCAVWGAFCGFWVRPPPPTRFRRPHSWSWRGRWCLTSPSRKQQQSSR